MRMPSSAKTTAATGCISANSGHSVVRLVEDVGVGGEQRAGRRRASASNTPPMTSPAASDSSSIRRAAAKASSASPGAERPADDDLPGDGDRVEHQRQEDEELEARSGGPRATAAPMRASTAVASVKHASSEPRAHDELRRRSQRASGMRARSGAAPRARAAARSAKAAPIPSCARPCPRPSRRAPSRSRRRTAARARRWRRWRRRR